MELIIDANILFAALIRNNITAEFLFRDDLHLFAPEFLIEEFEKYRDFLLKKSNRPSDEFSRVLSIFQDKIDFISYEEIKDHIDNALKISPDPKDVPYIALSLKLHIPIWSNDKKLKEKQDTIKILNTQELIELL